MTGKDDIKAPAGRRAYIALGSNLGDREAQLAEALRRLHARDGITVDRVSAVYETDPVGYVDQPKFLNMAAALTTERQPLDLLRAGCARFAGGRARSTWICCCTARCA